MLAQSLLPVVIGVAVSLLALGIAHDAHGQSLQDTIAANERAVAQAED
jgi:hypothetical protein